MFETPQGILSMANLRILIYIFFGALVLFTLGCGRTVTMNQIDTKHNKINGFEVKLNKDTCEYDRKDLEPTDLYTVTEVDGKTVVTFDKKVHGSFFFSSKDVGGIMNDAKTECQNRKVDRAQVQILCNPNRAMDFHAISESPL